MEQKDKHLLVGSTSFTFTSAVVTFLTYQTDESGNPWAWIPAIGVLIGVPMIIVAISTVVSGEGVIDSKINSLKPLPTTAVSEMRI